LKIGLLREQADIVIPFSPFTRERKPDADVHKKCKTAELFGFKGQRYLGYVRTHTKR